MAKTNRAIGVLIVGAMLSGCSTGSAVRGPASSAGAGAWWQPDNLPPQPMVVQANNCEIYVDAVSPIGNWVVPNQQDPNPFHALALWIKTPIYQDDGRSPKLSGDIRRVVFRYKLKDYNGSSSGNQFCTTEVRDYEAWYDCMDLGHWRAIEFVPTSNSGDYWVGVLPIDHKGTFSKQYEGAFYVETSDGHQYWLDKDGQPESNFDIDIGTFTDTQGKLGHTNYTLERSSAFQTSQDSSQPYLNPGRCNVLVK